MMYVHYCHDCNRLHILNGHKTICPACNQPLAELQISYLDFVELDKDERNAFRKKCANPETLKELSTTYRLHKYSKWYREREREKQLGSS